MTYDKPIPGIDNIHWLSKLVWPFPVTVREILETAKIWDFSQRTLDFLKLFPGDQQFVSEHDFMTRCSALEELLYTERESSIELLHIRQV